MFKKKLFHLLSLLFILLVLTGCTEISTKDTTNTTIATTNTDVLTTESSEIPTITESATTKESETITESKTTAITSSWTTVTTRLDTDETTLSTPITDSDTLKLINNYYKALNLNTLITKSKSEITNEIKKLLNDCKITISYTNTRDYFKYTDENPDNKGYVQMFYTHIEVKASSFSIGNTYNREHVWPQSLGQSKDEPGGKDLHHIRPSVEVLNSARGNLVYGNVSHTTSTTVKYNNTVYAYKTSSAFEPMDDVKGDCARICFYYAIKYGYNLSVIVSDDTYKEILEWNRLDPISNVEINRNNYVQTLQGNRNIFIDYPSLADIIWG